MISKKNEDEYVIFIDISNIFNYYYYICNKNLCLILKFKSIKTFTKRMVIMSVALVMLCMTTAAQNGKSEKNLADDCYGVTIGTLGILMPGEIRGVEITPMIGYDNPYVIYNGQIVNAAEGIIGKGFIGKLRTLNGRIYFIEIIARDVKEKTEEAIFVRAVPIPSEWSLNRNSTQEWGACLDIIVDPNLKSK